MTKCKIISALKIEMIGANPFFKRQMPRSRVYTREDAMRDSELKSVRDKYENNSAVRVDAHPRFGFKTMLSGSKVPLPTAPGIVGGNVDWTSAKSTPATMYLQSVLSGVRPMMSAPALGSFLGLREPQQNSIHTNL
jgi:hypothetical protein